MADENSENASHPLDGSSDGDSCDIVSATELSNPAELNQTSIELEQGDIHQANDEENIYLDQENQQAEKESLRKKGQKCKNLRKKRGKQYSDVVINTQPSHAVVTGKNKHNRRKNSTESYSGFVCCFLANSNDNDLRSIAVIVVKVVALMVLVIVLKTASALLVTASALLVTVKGLMDSILMLDLLDLRYQAF